MLLIRLRRLRNACLKGSDMALAAADPALDASEEAELIGRIPVRNLWVLMLYASRLYKDIAKYKGRRSVEEAPDDIPDLVAEMLCHHVEHRIRRNLSHGHQSRKDVLRRVRGRIDLLHTERRQLLKLGKVACEFNELTINTVRNRYVRAALKKASKIVRDKDKSLLAHRCRSLARRLNDMGVIGEKPSRTEINNERFGRNDADDQPMLAMSHLIFDLALPTESAGTKHLALPHRKIEWVRKLYEKGIAGFYDARLSPKSWDVGNGERIYWQVEKESQGIGKVLPSMKTDIILRDRYRKRRIVIDTKFNSLVTRGWYRDETLRSGYIYQMYAYLRSQEGTDDPLADNASGILLHPSVGEMVNEAVVIQNHEITFATVDLTAPAKEIPDQLMKVLEPHFRNRS